MSLPQNSPARQAVAQLVAELGRATRALECGALEDARDALARARALDPGNLQAAALEEQLQRGAPRHAGPPSASFMEQPAWLSFERNVRARRAARCAERADAALASGAGADAAAAIDELAQLVPLHPRLPELRARAAALNTSSSFDRAGVSELSAVAPDVTGAEAPGARPIAIALPASDRPTRRAISRPPPARAGVAAAAALLLFVGAGFAMGSWWWLRNTEPRAAADVSTRPVQRRGSDPIADNANIPRAAASESGPANTPPEEFDRTLAAPAPDPADLDAAEGTAPPASSTEPPAPLHQAPAREENRTASHAVTTELPAPDVRPSSERAPLGEPLGDVAAPVGTAGAAIRPAPATSISPSEAISPLGNGLPAPARDEAPAREREAAAVAPAPTAPPAAPVDADVRHVLEQYALGYSSRQAAVVRQIWPSVDARALERAFGQLQSQQVSFDTCTIDAAEATATATCSGRARWVPAVGDRSPREQSRTWRFVLGRGTQGWIITEARVESQ